MTAALFTVLDLYMVGEGDFARVASVLVGMWVAITLELHGLLRARKLRMDRDDIYAAHLAQRVTTPQPIRRVVRELIPDPQIFDTEPTDFDLEAAAYARTRGRA